VCRSHMAVGLRVLFTRGGGAACAVYKRWWGYLHDKRHEENIIKHGGTEWNIVAVDKWWWCSHVPISDLDRHETALVTPASAHGVSRSEYPSVTNKRENVPGASITCVRFLFVCLFVCLFQRQWW
jgi:hypothetical protein